MSAFFLIVEIFSYCLALFLFLKKKELAIIYIPVLIFSHILIDPVLPAYIYYGKISFLLLFFITRNQSFYRNNIFAILLFIYFVILLNNSSDLKSIRPHVFSVLWLFTLIPLISSVYQKYPREHIVKELTNSALLILTLFIANVLVSSVYNYSPNEMYGITSGILYGNLFGAGFNSLAIALFIVLLKIISERRLLYVLVLIISFLFVMLTLRRSVMGLSLFGVAIAAFTLMTRRKAKKLFLFGGILILIGYLIYSNTGFMSQFKERVELRKLDEKPLEEEQRFFEYELLYKDMFVYKVYDPLFGFELFNSPGNYGRGIFRERSLHADLTNIAHSSGILGVLFYLLMVFTAFRQSYRVAKTSSDKFIIFFCAVTFLVYTITGRYTEIVSMLFIYLVLMLPVTKEDNQLELENN